jgi:hypothetical protein
MLWLEHVGGVKSEVPLAVLVKNTLNAYYNKTPCISIGIYRCFGATYCLLLQDRRTGKTGSKQSTVCLPYSSTLKIETVRSSEMSANFFQNT